MNQDIISLLLNRSKKLAVVGLGYVGLPLAVAFSEANISVIGFDLQTAKIENYKKGIDPTNEIGSTALKNSDIFFTDDFEYLHEALVFIIAVPTPIKGRNIPDFSQLVNACELVGANLSQGDYVVFESTVYPGATEEICLPILEKISGLSVGIGFKLGYSPERINPGDSIHTLKNISKIVSACDEQALYTLKRLYKLIIAAGVYPVSNIKTAEAIKITENAQRDVNIAFMNEVSLFYHKMGISTNEVIDGMNTKWNYLGFRPGLVGGHCIGIDPYYLLYIAEKYQTNLEIIKTARRVNEQVSRYILSETINILKNEKVALEKSRVCILGVTFKENCADIRNSKVIDIVNGLLECGIDVCVVDPLADSNETKKMYGVDLSELISINNVDCILVAVAHNCFRTLNVEGLKKMFSVHHKPILVDVKGIFDKRECEDSGYIYFSL